MRKSVVIITLLVTLQSALPPAAIHAQGGDDLPPAVHLTGLRHEFQTWCNCGPVNLMMALSYYGWQGDQTVTAAALKPIVQDKNVSPYEMVDYVNGQKPVPDLLALYRYGGDLALLKRLVAAGFPVIVESGFQPEGHEWMGHYITVVGYDDATAMFWTYDSYDGYNQTTSYADFDAMWRHFNHIFILLYPKAREQEVHNLLGPLVDDGTAAGQTAQTAEAEIASGQDDVWTWFNLGTAHVALKNYENAVQAYERAFEFEPPFRLLWYQFGPFEAYYHTGRYFEVLQLVATVEQDTAELEELNYWRGMALAALDQPEAALAAFDAALVFNPHTRPVKEARLMLTTGTLEAPAPLHVQAAPYLP